MLTRSAHSAGVGSCPHCQVTCIKLCSNSLLAAPARRSCIRVCCYKLSTGYGQRGDCCRFRAAICSSRQKLQGVLQYATLSEPSTYSHGSSCSAMTPAAAGVWYDTWGEDSEDDEEIIEIRPPHARQRTLGVSSAAQEQQRGQQSRPQQAHSEPVLPQQQLSQRRQANQTAADVCFSIKQQVEYGQCLRVVGSAPRLGAWDPAKGCDMTWRRHHRWSAEVQLPVGTYEFKYVLVHRSGHLEWEPGSNRVFDVLSPTSKVQVQGHWGATDDTEVLELRNQQQQHHKQGQQHLQQQALSHLGNLQRHQQTAVSVNDIGPKAPASAVSPADWPSVLLQQQQHMAAASALQPVQRQGNAPTQATSGAAAGMPYVASAAGSHHTSPAPGTQGVPAVLQVAAPAAKDPAALLLSALPSGLSTRQQQLVKQVSEQRHRLSSSISGIAADVKDMESELSMLHDELAHITAERVLQEQLQRQPGVAASANSSSSKSAAAGDSSDGAWPDLVAAALAKAQRAYTANPKQGTTDHLDRVLSPEDQQVLAQLNLLAGKAGIISKSELQHMASRGIGSRHGSAENNLSTDAQLNAAEAELLAHIDRLAGMEGASSSGSSQSKSPPRSWVSDSGGQADANSSMDGTGSSGQHAADATVLPATQQGETVPMLSSSDPAKGGLSDSVQCAVLNWRQELLTFRHDTLLLQEELAAVDDTISSAQEQIAVNKAALANQEQQKQRQKASQKPSAAAPANKTGVASAATPAPAAVAGGNLAADVAKAAALAAAAAAAASFAGQVSAGAPKVKRIIKYNPQKQQHSSSAGQQSGAGAAHKPHSNAPLTNKPSDVASQVARGTKHSESQDAATATNSSLSNSNAERQDGSAVASTSVTAGTTDANKNRTAAGATANNCSAAVNSQAAVADTVAEYQRLLRQRFNELAYQIAADLASSAASLTEEAEHQRQQYEQDHHDQQHTPQHRHPQQHSQKQQTDPSAAKFAAAHHAAAAAYANGKTHPGDNLSAR